MRDPKSVINRASGAIIVSSCRRLLLDASADEADQEGSQKALRADYPPGLIVLSTGKSLKLE